MIAIASGKSATLVTTWLEMTGPADFAPAYVNANDIEIVKMETPDLALYRFLYHSVGAECAWRDRLQISNAELRQILSPPTTQVHVLYVGGSPRGYIELCRQDDNSVEIAYFGLQSEIKGRGLGKHLLSYGVARAWEMAAARIWLHTCNLDGPHALANYRKRGFRTYRVVEEPMPELYTKAPAEISKALALSAASNGRQHRDVFCAQLQTDSFDAARVLFFNATKHSFRLGDDREGAENIIAN